MMMTTNHKQSNATSGNVLPVILLLLSIITITIATFLIDQTADSVRYSKEKKEIQDLATLRSGLLMFASQQRIAFTSEKKFNISLGQDLFDNINISPTLEKKEIHNRMIFPFNDTVNSCSIDICTTDLYIDIVSALDGKNGILRESLRFGSQLPDSEKVLYTNSAHSEISESIKLFNGNAVYAIDTQYKNNVVEKLIDTTGVNRFTSKIKSDLDFVAASEKINCLIQSKNDLKTLPKIINGDLFFDSNNKVLVLEDTIERFVTGDLQTTGTVTLKKFRIYTQGEIRLFDNITTANCSFFSRGRVFIGDQNMKSTVNFNGTVISFNNIEIASEVNITNKSYCLHISEPATDKQHNNNYNSVIFVRPNAIINGVVLNLNPHGCIEIFNDAQTEGIIYSRGAIKSGGVMYGCVIASSVLPPPDKSQAGTISRLQTINSFILPYFFNQKKIINWTQDHVKN